MAGCNSKLGLGLELELVQRLGPMMGNCNKSKMMKRTSQIAADLLKLLVQPVQEMVMVRGRQLVLVRGRQLRPVLVVQLELGQVPVQVLELLGQGLKLLVQVLELLVQVLELRVPELVQLGQGQLGQMLAVERLLLHVVLLRSYRKMLQMMLDMKRLMMVMYRLKD